MLICRSVAPRLTIVAGRNALPAKAAKVKAIAAKANSMATRTAPITGTTKAMSSGITSEAHQAKQVESSQDT